MMVVNELKTKIMTVIKDNNFDIEKLKLILDPIGSYVSDPLFVQNIDGVIDIITKDRNGDQKFDIEDLRIFGQDPMAILSLVGAVMLIVCGIPQLKLKYNQGATEELIFKLLSYIFLVIVPTRIGRPLTLEEKDAILNITLASYQMLKSSNLVQGIIADVSAKLRSKGWCVCLVGPTTDDAQEKLDKHLSMAKLNLSQSVNTARTMNELTILKQKYESEKNANII